MYILTEAYMVELLLGVSYVVTFNTPIPGLLTGTESVL